MISASANCNSVQATTREEGPSTGPPTPLSDGGPRQEKITAKLVSSMTWHERPTTGPPPAPRTPSEGGASRHDLGVSHEHGQPPRALQTRDYTALTPPPPVSRPSPPSCVCGAAPHRRCPVPASPSPSPAFLPPLPLVHTPAAGPPRPPVHPGRANPAGPAGPPPPPASRAGGGPPLELPPPPPFTDPVTPPPRSPRQDGGLCRPPRRRWPPPPPPAGRHRPPVCAGARPRPPGGRHCRRRAPRVGHPAGRRRQ